MLVVAGNGGALFDPWSYILYMVAAGAGFSTAENLEYLFLTGAHLNHRTRPDCFPAETASELVVNACGRLLLAYPLHLACGALTGGQLVRHHLSDERLHWGWVMVPAVLTHGSYDSILFCLAALGVRHKQSQHNTKT